MARDIDRFGVEGIVRRIKNRVKDSPVYITFGIDVLDPAGGGLATVTMEPGGWTSREALEVLDGLQGISVVGADICEVSPPFDIGEVTTQTAGEIVRSILSLMVLKAVLGGTFIYYLDMLLVYP